jgi:hypothetical protein
MRVLETWQNQTANAVDDLGAWSAQLQDILICPKGDYATR